MFSTGIGGSYVSTASAAFEDEMREEIKLVKHERVSQPLAPPRPPEPSAPPPTERAFTARSTHATAQVRKKERQPFVADVVSSLLYDPDDGADAAYADDMRTHAEAQLTDKGIAPVGRGVADLIQFVQPGDSDESEDDESGLGEYQPLGQPGAFAAHFGVVENGDDDDDSGDEKKGDQEDGNGVRGGMGGLPIVPPKVSEIDMTGTGFENKTDALLPPPLALTRWDPSKFDPRQVTLPTIEPPSLPSFDPEKDLNPSAAAEAISRVDPVELAKEAMTIAQEAASVVQAQAEEQARMLEELSSPVTGADDSPQQSRAANEAEFVARMTEVEHPLGFDEGSATRLAALANLEQRQAAARQQAADAQADATSGKEEDLTTRLSKMSVRKGVKALWQSAKVAVGVAKPKGPSPKAVAKQLKAAEDARLAAEKATMELEEARRFYLDTGLRSAETPMERERRRLARLARLGVVQPKVQELADTESESSDDEAVEEWAIGDRVEVNRGGGKGWELGTVVKLAEISDADRAADQAHTEAAAAAAAARAAAVAAEALATSAAAAGQVISDGVSKLTGSGSSSNTSSGNENDSSDTKLSKVYAVAKGSGVLAKLRAKADRADRRAARKERDAARQARARAKRRVRRALPSVQLDGWKTASTYRQMRRVKQASQRLAADESEAQVAAWAPQPLEVLLVPDYPGTPAGYLLYPGQTFVYKRRVVLRFSNVLGHGGREFQMAFYELADGTGWVHDFCTTNPEGRSIEEMGSGSGARDSVLGALQGLVGDALAGVPFSGQTRHDATAIASAEEQAKKAKEAEARRRKLRRQAAAQPVPNADDDPNILRAQLNAKAADKAARLSHQSTSSWTPGNKSTKKKAGKMPPQYLAKLEAVKAQYGQAKYDELIWWKDKGTLAHQDEQAALDAAEVASLQAANEARRAAAVSLHGWFGVEVSESEKQAALHEAAEAKIKAQSAAAAVASQVAARATLVSFDPLVRVLHVPSWRILRPHARVALWTPSQELKAAKKRNLVEYEFESFDWTKVVPDEQFVVHGGEKIHPVHLFAERLHQQTVAELRLLDDEVRELHQFKRMVRELVVEPAYANHLASTTAATAEGTNQDEEKDAVQGHGDKMSKAKKANKAKKAAAAKTALTEMPLDYWQGRYASVGDPHLAGADPFDRARAQREVRRAREDALNRLKAPQQPWGVGREAMISGEDTNESFENHETGAAASLSRGRSLEASASEQKKNQERGTGDGNDGADDDDIDDIDDEGIEDEVDDEDDYGPDAPTDDLRVESSLLGDGGPETRARLKLRGSSVKAFKGSRGQPSEYSTNDDEDDDAADGFPVSSEDDVAASDDAALVELAVLNGDVSACLSVAESARAKAAAKQAKLEAQYQEEAKRVERLRRREDATRSAGKPLRLGQRLRDEATGSGDSSSSSSDIHDAGTTKKQPKRSTGGRANAAPPSGRLEAGLDKAKLDMIKLGLVNGGSHVPASKLYDDANKLRRDHTKERLKILRELSELRGLVSILTKTDDAQAENDSDSEADASISRTV